MRRFTTTAAFVLAFASQVVGQSTPPVPTPVPVPAWTETKVTKNVAETTADFVSFGETRLAKGTTLKRGQYVPEDAGIPGNPITLTTPVASVAFPSGPSNPDPDLNLDIVELDNDRMITEEVVIPQGIPIKSGTKPTFGSVLVWAKRVALIYPAALPSGRIIPNDTIAPTGRGLTRELSAAASRPQVEELAKQVESLRKEIVDARGANATLKAQYEAASAALVLAKKAVDADVASIATSRTTASQAATEAVDAAYKAKKCQSRSRKSSLRA